MILEERERFEREYGCTETEWVAWMPKAAGGCALAPAGPQALRVDLGPGQQLQLTWRVLPPRVIALMRLPRLAVSFSFEGTALDARRAFLRHFDLCLQRGGG